MFKSLKLLFDEKISEFAGDTEIPHSLELACAALLIEISRADHDIAAIEISEIKTAIRATFNLDDDVLDDLITTAGVAVEEATSLYGFTSIINEQFDRRQKVALIEMLWRVAYADLEIDRYEEYYVRKIADLIHLPHREFIAAKIRAAESAGLA